MRLASICKLGLLWLTVVITHMDTKAQAAGRRGCCTAFSTLRAESLMNVEGKVQCWRQGITEGCNINAVVLRLKRRYVCINPRPRNMRNVINVLCNRATGKQ